MSGLGDLRRRAFSCAPMDGLRWISPQAMSPRFDRICPMFLCTEALVQSPLLRTRQSWGCE